MKKIIGALITVLVLYVIYYDFTNGSLPSESEQNIAVPVSAPTPDIQNIKKEVKPGDTVLSLVEKNSFHPLPVSISKVISDFQELNNGKKPEDIQIGKFYKFPIYKELD